MHNQPDITCPVIEALAARLEEQSQGDPMSAAIVAKMRQRSRIGIAKYGKTLARQDLDRKAWLVHAQEEALDLVAYLEALRYHQGETHELTKMQVHALTLAACFEHMLTR